MRRREILVFTAAFVVVLLGGAALAQVSTFASSPSADVAALSEPAATETVSHAEETPTTSAPTPTTSAAAEDRQPEPIAEEGDDKDPSEPPTDEEPPSDPPKDEEPPADEDTTPPPLAILFPENEQHFEDKVVAFEGETEPGARVFGGNYEADVDSEGNWRVVLVLSPGGNTVTFKAKDAAGNITKNSIKVYLDARRSEGSRIHCQPEVGSLRRISAEEQVLRHRHTGNDRLGRLRIRRGQHEDRRQRRMALLRRVPECTL